MPSHFFFDRAHISQGPKRSLGIIPIMGIYHKVLYQGIFLIVRTFAYSQEEDRGWYTIVKIQIILLNGRIRDGKYRGW